MELLEQESKAWTRKRLGLEIRRNIESIDTTVGPVEWGCRIHRLYLGRGIRPSTIGSLVSWGCRTQRLHRCRGLRPHPKKRPVGLGCRIQTVSLLRGETLPRNFLDITQTKLRLQQWWKFGECRVPLRCHRSQVHSGLEWLTPDRPYQWVK